MIKKLLIILIIFFIPTICYGATKQVLTNHTPDDTDATATEYFSLYGDGGAGGWWTEANKNVVWPSSGTIDDLRVNIPTDPANGAGVQIYTFTVRVDGAGTTLTCAISEGATSCTNSS